MSCAQETYSAAERERLILEHLPQVRWIASSIGERLPENISQEDLVSTGIIGLIHAIDNFDPQRNASLRTYAEIRIRGAILDSIRGLDGIDPHKRKRVRLVQNAISTLEQRHGRSATEEEIAQELGIPDSEYGEWLRDLRGITLGSLDTLNSDEGSPSLMMYIADPRSEDPCATLERSEMQHLLAQGIEALPQNERLVLDLYFHQELTLTEIGRVLGVHFSRISQLKVQAILRLRSFLRFRLTPRRTLDRTA